MPEDNNSNHDLTEGTTNYDSGSLPHFEEKESIIEGEYESNNNNSFDGHQKRDEMQVGHYEKVTNSKPPNLPKKGNNDINIAGFIF